MDDQSSAAPYTLAHPLYLDVQMMVSFLAYLEGGVSFEGEETIRSGETRTREGKVSGKMKFPSIASWLGAEAAGDLAIDKKLDEGSEYKAARHHTAASLFNYLYSYLSNDGQFITLDNMEDVQKMQANRLVQISGRYLGNPLADILNYFGQLMPYIEDDEAEKKDHSKRRNPRKSGNPAIRASVIEQGVDGTQSEPLDDDSRRLMKTMQEDMNSSPVQDIVLATSGGLKAVLTVSSQYYSAETSAHLRAGDYIVLGKATRILRADEFINLARRTAMGILNQEITRASVIEAASHLGLDADSANPIVSAPAVQILPMAIFV